MQDQAQYGKGGQPLSMGVAGQIAGVQRTLSHGVKFLLLCLTALFMSLLALFVSSLTDERTGRAAEVSRELSGEAGGPQVYLGPTLLLPYTKLNTDPKLAPQPGVFAIAPRTGSANVTIRAEERRRSLFSVPVFQSDVRLQAVFDLRDLVQALPSDVAVDWGRAAIVVGVSQERSALQEGTLESTDGTLPLGPIAVQRTLQIDGKDAAVPVLALVGVSAGHVRQDAPFTVVAHLRFSGAQRAAVLAYARATTVTMRGNWSSPGFDGQFLPAKHAVGGKGFTADWFLPSLARNIAPVADVSALGSLGATAMGTNLVEVADAYQSVNRALKYAPLFLGLVFLSYFLFEVTAHRPVHPAQYVLVGVAQLIFYLLLLSFAERIGFDWGFLLAGAASVLLLGWNAGWVFRSAVQRTRALAIFGALYGLIYLLLRLQDNALMVGALGSFAAIGAALYFTRDLDWYGEGAALKAEL